MFSHFVVEIDNFRKDFFASTFVIASVVVMGVCLTAEEPQEIFAYKVKVLGESGDMLSSMICSANSTQQPSLFFGKIGFFPLSVSRLQAKSLIIFVASFVDGMFC